MWTMGYHDNGGEFSFSQPFNGSSLKLRPLVPRPSPSLRVNGTNFCAQYFHLASYLNLNEQSKRELNDSSSSNSPAAVVVSSSRWNPTVEQLRILEELYRRGTRTPSADQIQHITAQLRRYGKIEGKNVFYWFQNHKARERQKRRRQTAAAADQTKHSEAEKGYEIQQTKTNCCWPPPSNNCTTYTFSHSQGHEERRRREGEMVINPMRKTLHHRNGVVEPNGEKCCGSGGEGCETTTLQLFPLRSTKLCKNENDSEREGRQEDQLGIMSDSDNMTVVKTSPFTPTSTFQFFEFLPLKN